MGLYDHEGARRCKKLVNAPPRKRGRTTPAGKPTRVEAIMSPTLVHAAKIAAAIRGVSLSTFVADAVKSAIGVKP